MANQIVQFIQKHLRNILFWTLLFISSAVFTTISGQNLNAERDSLINEVQKYPADTTRFLVFSNFFWQYANTDLPRVKSIGQLAFKEIKNSHNIKLFLMVMILKVLFFGMKKTLILHISILRELWNHR